VRGVEVGDTTLISGNGPLKVGEGPVRTGVIVVFPRGKANPDPVYAGWFAQNGNGEMTGTTWVEESGFLESPIAITNTHSVGVVRDAIIAWGVKHDALSQPWSLPVVAETWDGYLNDINGFHVKPEDVFSALDGAHSGPVDEGAVGGGTGMVCYGFKGGIGTASRLLTKEQGGYTVGVLVQCNCGRRPQLTIAGVPVGKLIPQDVPYSMFKDGKAGWGWRGRARPRGTVQATFSLHSLRPIQTLMRSPDQTQFWRFRMSGSRHCSMRRSRRRRKRS
jgi:L-aminopeptidase/D-esterase-like protein